MAMKHFIKLKSLSNMPYRRTSFYKMLKQINKQTGKGQTSIALCFECFTSVLSFPKPVALIEQPYSFLLLDYLLLKKE
jgi:hypothetical protein